MMWSYIIDKCHHDSHKMTIFSDQVQTRSLSVTKIMVSKFKRELSIVEIQLVLCPFSSAITDVSHLTIERCNNQSIISFNRIAMRMFASFPDLRH